MSDQTPGGSAAFDTLPLPDNPSLEWLRKESKRRLDELRKANPSTQLAVAQFDIAKQYGFASWRALKAHIDSLRLDGQLFDAARNGDLTALRALLDEHPDKVLVHNKPYAWSLLHAAAQNGHLAIVDMLLDRGLDVNTREAGDNTYAMHWAAAAGHLDVVRRLADAGGDVVGHGDDHSLEVIGWATCWDGTDDDVHRAIGDFLVSRGAQHHIFSAIAMNLADEVRRVVSADPDALNRQLKKFQEEPRPLHFAVSKNRPEMLALLFELGAHPFATDAFGCPVAGYAMQPVTNTRIRDIIREHSPKTDLFTLLALGDWDTAEYVVAGNPDMFSTKLHKRATTDSTLLHQMAKRNNVSALKWLLAHDADPNVLLALGDARMTAMHLATWEGNAEVVRLLLDAGADPTIHDGTHHSDVMGWAEFAGKAEIVEILKRRVTSG